MDKSHMIRPIDWRDLALLHRMSSSGLCLDSQLAYTRGHHALLSAVLNALTPGKKTSTLIARPAELDQSPAVGQILQRSKRPYARLAFIGPKEALAQPNCLKLLDALSQSAGETGAHHLIAEADEDCEVFENLQRAGFAIFARQRIWRLSGPIQVDATPQDAAWRFEANSDEPAIQALYLNLVPALVQRVEPPPTPSGRGLVYWTNNELLGYLDVDHGPKGVWVQPYIHPAAERTSDLLAGFLTQHPNQKDKPLYVCVRSYQGGLSVSLDALGFQPFSDQAVMVKRLTAAIRHPARAALPALEGTQPEPTAPFTPLRNQPSAHEQT
jgi:hypothetical protein